jgi:[acyl-carrier-protein] S-malonyltransferase
VKLAFLYPGQGMQGPTLPETFTRGSAEWTCLEQVLGSDISRVIAQGGPQLERTDVLQPALVAACLSVTARLFEGGVSPAVVAGHSVGEIAALAAAGAVAASGAIELAATRGRLMAREAARHPGGMLALQEATEKTVEEALAVGAPHGVIGLGAVNAPDQWVLSGEIRALDAVAARFPGRRLQVAGAWHSPLMAGALSEFESALRGLALQPTRNTLIANRNGQPVSSSDDLTDILGGQLVRPVQWIASLNTLERLGVTDVVTVGPGRVLRGLIRKNLGTRLRVHTTEDAADLANTMDRLKGSSHG